MSSVSARPVASLVLSRLALPALAALTLTSCAGLFDPYQREGTWRPAGLAASNRRAMAADQRDLLSGAGDPGGQGVLAARAVARLRADKVKDLPDSGVSKLVPVGVGGAPAGGGSAAGGEE